MFERTYSKPRRGQDRNVSRRHVWSGSSPSVRAAVGEAARGAGATRAGRGRPPGRAGAGRTLGRVAADRSPAVPESPAAPGPPAPGAPDRPARPALGVAMVLLAGTLFAVNGTVSKLILHAGVDAAHLTTLRATGASLGLLVLCLLVPPGPRRLRVRPADLPLLVAYGLAGFLLVPMLYFVAIDRLPVGIGLLFEYTAPLLVALWARFGQRQPVRSRLWVGLALALAGLAGVAQVWRGFRLDVPGVLAGLGAAALLAVYYVLGARGVRQRDTLSLTWWAFTVSAAAGALLRPWWSFPYRALSGGSGGVPVPLLVAYLICFGSITAYLLVAGSLRHLPPTSAGIVGMVEPVIAAAVAWVALGETLSAAQLAGGALILGGVALAETARTAGPGGPVEIPPA
jgi:drug/metabolite transporter (DMT)-like permease